MLIAQYKEANSFKDLSPSCMKDIRYRNAVQIHNVLVSSSFKFNEAGFTIKFEYIIMYTSVYTCIHGQVIINSIDK